MKQHYNGGNPLYCTLLLSILYICNNYACAASSEKQNISNLVQNSDVIVRTKVLSTQSQWKQDDRGNHIYTTVSVKIIDKIKGKIGNDTLTFEIIGGSVDGIREEVSDMPTFVQDEDTVIFLSGQPLTIKGGLGSKVSIRNDRAYWNNSGIKVDKFLESLRILEQNPDAKVSLDTEQEFAQTEAAECFKYGNRKWASPVVEFFINENTSDCTGEGAAVRAAANTWNNATSNFSFQYAGTHSGTVASQNDINEIMWGTISDSNVIARATVWIDDVEIVECDIVFNDAYNWSTSPSSSQMDVQTVALHELGHWLRLLDLYDDGDSANVMYGYGSKGQTKRELQPCDISGICYIYGGCASVVTPVFTPGAGSYASKQYVTVSCSTPGAVIHFTTNGVDPTESDLVVVSGSSLFINHSLMLKAKAWKTGLQPSSVKSANYVITDNCPQTDLNNDCFINFKDFSKFAYWWNYNCDSANNWCQYSDFDLSGNSDLDDLIIVVDEWLIEPN
ncbi:MAG: chitobiase/beta-hexosaminidase C-terminal domain-containing protein [Phycisphaerales bacterium]